MQTDWKQKYEELLDTFSATVEKQKQLVEVAKQVCAEATDSQQESPADGARSSPRKSAIAQLGRLVSEIAHAEEKSKENLAEFFELIKRN